MLYDYLSPLINCKFSGNVDHIYFFTMVSPMPKKYHTSEYFSTILGIELVRKLRIILRVEGGRNITQKTRICEHCRERLVSALRIIKEDFKRKFFTYANGKVFKNFFLLPLGIVILPLSVMNASTLL